MANIDQEHIRRIAELVRRLENLPNAEDRKTAHSLLEAVLELHGAGLDRMMEIVFDAGESGRAMIRRFAGDNLISSLLVLHGLHPDDVQTRVQHALAKAHVPAELLGVFEGSVRVRLTASGCGLKDSVATALREAVPDATEIVIEEASPMNDFVPITSLGAPLPSLV